MATTVQTTRGTENLTIDELKHDTTLTELTSEVGAYFAGQGPNFTAAGLAATIPNARLDNRDYRYYWDIEPHTGEPIMICVKEDHITIPDPGLSDLLIIVTRTMSE